MEAETKQQEPTSATPSTEDEKPTETPAKPKFVTLTTDDAGICNLDGECS